MVIEKAKLLLRVSGAERMTIDTKATETGIEKTIRAGRVAESKKTVV